jgi:hypothetical protein
MVNVNHVANEGLLKIVKYVSRTVMLKNLPVFMRGIHNSDAMTAAAIPDHPGPKV